MSAVGVQLAPALALQRLPLGAYGDKSWKGRARKLTPCLRAALGTDGDHSCHQQPDRTTPLATSLWHSLTAPDTRFLLARLESAHPRQPDFPELQPVPLPAPDTPFLVPIHRSRTSHSSSLHHCNAAGHPRRCLVPSLTPAHLGTAGQGQGALGHTALLSAVLAASHSRMGLGQPPQY
ncbi:hypothetical protein NDU88_008248 [Pleurodeles waltl]|uniref:Uncharacterized protein n=1 Tax=Pleurodeles waltl TaxID=8319 RepID=A0AAV7N6I4_PLEWA|nr:hypothetical protein NDU88_008248 [Pleurodeles waltl]